MKVKTKEEAMDWFLSNRDEIVICVKGEAEKSCSNYPEAKEFFENKEIPDAQSTSNPSGTDSQ